MEDLDIFRTTQSDLLSKTKDCKSGLESLRDEHFSILGDLKNEKNISNNVERKNSDDLVNERIKAVTASLSKVDIGVEESGVILSLSSHFNRLEAEKTLTKLEMGRIKDENDWLREELEDTEKRLEDAILRVTELEEEKKHWVFMEEVKKLETAADLKPVTPSKIPVGSFRVEEEKAINRALNGSGNGFMDSNRRSSERAVSPSPAPPVVSRIPMLSNKLGANYKKVQEKIEKAENERQERTKKLRGKSHKLTLTPATSNTSIPSR